MLEYNMFKYLTNYYLFHCSDRSCGYIVYPMQFTAF